MDSIRTLSAVANRPPRDDVPGACPPLEGLEGVSSFLLKLLEGSSPTLQTEFEALLSRDSPPDALQQIRRFPAELGQAITSASGTAREMIDNWIDHRTYPPVPKALFSSVLAGQLKRYAESLAQYCVFRLLASQHSQRISRCGLCRRYFVRQRVRLGPAIGSVCRECRTAASVIRMSASRRRRLHTAALAWLDWKNADNTDQKQFVASVVNKKHHLAVGRRWVSQNIKEIVSLAEDLKSAKPMTPNDYNT